MYQAKKAALIAGPKVVKDSLATSWKIKEGQVYFYQDEGEKEQQDDPRGKVYKIAGEKDLYCVISEDVKLDASAFKVYKTAIEKGIAYRKSGQNGIKLVGGIYELKMYGILDDERPYTSEIFVNKYGKCLLVFDQIGNHQTITRKLRETQHTKLLKVFVEGGVPNVDHDGPQLYDYLHHYTFDDLDVDLAGDV